MKYYPGEDCVECVKDLIRFLRRDDENHEVMDSVTVEPTFLAWRWPF